MSDRIVEAFLQRQAEEGRALAAESDLIALSPAGSPPDRYLLELACAGLVEAAPGEIVEARHFVVGISFPPSYLRVADSFQVLTWVAPLNVWHPNIAPREQLICIGRVSPGTGLVDLIYRVFEVASWNKVTVNEFDALNAAACQWARQHPDRFPVDRRPLKRRPLAARIEIVSEGTHVDGQNI